MKPWLPLLLRNSLPLSQAYTHFTIRKPYSREGLTMSLSHTFAEQKNKNYIYRMKTIVLWLQKRK